MDDDQPNRGAQPQGQPAGGEPSDQRQQEQPAPRQPEDRNGERQEAGHDQQHPDPRQEASRPKRPRSPPKLDWDRHYKHLMVFTIALLIGSVGLIGFKIISGEGLLLSIELKGGSVITVPAGTANLDTVQQSLPFPADVKVYTGTAGRGVSVTVGPETDTKQALSALSSLGLDVSKASTQTIGPALGATFWQQAQLGLVAAFIGMGVVVFILFRKPAPSIAVILAGFADIMETLAVMQIIGIELSLATLAALLMLIGYSVDTDVLQTTRLLKTGGEVRQRAWGSVKTGLTMTATTLGALVAILIFGVAPLLTQIAAVLVIGLILDVPNTYIQNLGMLRWYMEKRGIA